MKNQTECWEVSFGMEAYLFATHQDAAMACAAFIRGAQVFAPADPARQAERIGLRPVEATVRRVSVPVPVAKAVRAMGADARAAMPGSGVGPLQRLS